ncbi:hypothetical protein M3M38_07365 [Fructilactobacillus cliffordii]|uniref:hypothetical protein n=1 Tax=Fructilactobacillus cliffordii TaxID=2940299 RepID=UPI002093C708|nr:hypothetical protein [Fructilactobacillus cliffordii]USS86478.1 hypothetical protein M3M38_07365 [Fructilactobacillus cliffordii]
MIMKYYPSCDSETIRRAARFSKISEASEFMDQQIKAWEATGYHILHAQINSDVEMWVKNFSGHFTVELEAEKRTDK